MMTPKPITTVYNGYKFRSRLEARWAVFFDAMGIDYDYEPEGYDLGDAGWYLPDFWLPIKDTNHPHYPNAGYFIEIKPVQPSAEEIVKCKALTQETKHVCKMLWGKPGADIDGAITTGAKNILRILKEEIREDYYDGIIDHRTLPTGFIYVLTLCCQVAAISIDKPNAINEATAQAKQQRFTRAYRNRPVKRV